jgi:hypothetical protein
MLKLRVHATKPAGHFCDAPAWPVLPSLGLALRHRVLLLRRMRLVPDLIQT